MVDLCACFVGMQTKQRCLGDGQTVRLEHPVPRPPQGGAKFQRGTVGTGLERERAVPRERLRRQKVQGEKKEELTHCALGRPVPSSSRVAATWMHDQWPKGIVRHARLQRIWLISLMQKGWRNVNPREHMKGLKRDWGGSRQIRAKVRSARDAHTAPPPCQL